MAYQRPSSVWTLLAMTRWVCRSGSPARESRWVNATATMPRVSTLRMPCGPMRVYSWVSRYAAALATASWWRRSTVWLSSSGASAQSVETDFTGDSVRSMPAIVAAAGRDQRATALCSSRGDAGGRPYSLTKNSPATWLRIVARVSGSSWTNGLRPAEMLAAT